MKTINHSVKWFCKCIQVLKTLSDSFLIFFYILYFFINLIKVQWQFQWLPIAVNPKQNLFWEIIQDHMYWLSCADCESPFEAKDTEKYFWLNYRHALVRWFIAKVRSRVWEVRLGMLGSVKAPWWGHGGVLLVGVKKLLPLKQERKKNDAISWHLWCGITRLTHFIFSLQS